MKFGCEGAEDNIFTRALEKVKKNQVKAMNCYKRAQKGGNSQYNVFGWARCALQIGRLRFCTACFVQYLYVKQKVAIPWNIPCSPLQGLE